VPGHREVDVVGYVEVEPAVAVEVGEAGGETEAPLPHPGRSGGLDEGAVAVVVPELVAAEAHDIEVDPAVVVVVTGRHPHPVPPGRPPHAAPPAADIDEAGGGGDVDEIRLRAPVRARDGVVAEQAPAEWTGLGGGRAARRGGERPALDEEDVEVAVAVVVEE